MATPRARAGLWVPRAAAVALALGVAAPALAGEPFALTPEGVAAQSPSRMLMEDRQPSHPAWRFRAGDDPAWAAPDLDDADWPEVSTRGLGPWPGWAGIGWFRLELAVDPALRDATIAGVMQLGGAAELYLDGRRLGAWGRVDADPAREQAVRLDIRDEHAVFELPLDDAATHVLAVRFSNASAWSSPLPLARTLTHFIVDFEAAPKRIAGLRAMFLGTDLVLAGAYGAVALVFLILALIYREAPVHRYFGLTMLGAAAATAHDAVTMSVTSFWGWLALFFAGSLVAALTFVALLRLSFHLLDERAPRLFAWASGAAALAPLLLLVGLVPLAAAVPIVIYALITRNVFVALRRGAERSRLLTVGLAFGLTLTLLEVADEMIPGFRPLAVLGSLRPLTTDIALLTIIATATIHMARRTAQDSRALVALNRELEARVHERTAELQVAHARAEALLLNILPRSIAERLQAQPGVIADDYACVTVLFADIVGFTELAASMSSERIVTLLNRVFSAFDQLAERHGLEKIKTIGDAYMVVGGLPTRRDDHAEAIAEMALDMQAETVRLGAELGVPLRLRVGIHSGPVTAGVIGRQKYIYDLWGDAVNTASRMESHGLPEKIQVSEATFALLAARYRLDPRGSVEVKGKGAMTTFFLEGRRAAGAP